MKVAKFGFSLFGINTYVVWDEKSKECCIVDPGMINSVEEEVLKKFIINNRLVVTHLVNTHLHIDHAIGDSFVKREFNVPVEANLNDAMLGGSLRDQANMFGVIEKVEDVVIDKPLREGDVIKIGEGELHVLEVPGHSPGSIVLYDKEDNFVIVGDVLFQRSVGRSDLPGGNGPQLISGIKRKLMTLPDDTTVYPGHGPDTSIGQERMYNPFF